MLVVKYKDSDQKIVVPPSAEIITDAAATAADLTPGKKTSVFAAKKLPDGTLSAECVISAIIRRLAVKHFQMASSVPERD